MHVHTVEPPNKGHFGANSFVTCREVFPISEVNNTSISMVPQQVFFVERSSLSQWVSYQRFHCIHFTTLIWDVESLM